MSPTSRRFARRDAPTGASILSLHALHNGTTIPNPDRFVGKDSHRTWQCRQITCHAHGQDALRQHKVESNTAQAATSSLQVFQVPTLLCTSQLLQDETGTPLFQEKQGTKGGMPVVLETSCGTKGAKQMNRKETMREYMYSQGEVGGGTVGINGRRRNAPRHPLELYPP